MQAIKTELVIPSINIAERAQQNIEILYLPLLRKLEPISSELLISFNERDPRCGFKVGIAGGPSKFCERFEPGSEVITAINSETNSVDRKATILAAMVIERLRFRQLIS